MAYRVRDEEIANRLLLSLPPETLDAILPHFKRVELHPKQSIYRPGSPVHSIYFVDRGLISLVKTMRDGRTVEVNTRGIDALTTPEALFGLNTAILECMVQVPGSALTVPVRMLKESMADHPALTVLVQRYIHLSTDELAQTAACNRLHSLEERCCRWLLIAHDSARADHFPLTHQFLATMLGVQRPHVSATAALLQRAGLIRYNHGHVTVTDRVGLEETACECYAEIEAEFAHLFRHMRDVHGKGAPALKAQG